MLQPTSEALMDRAAPRTSTGTEKLTTSST